MQGKFDYHYLGTISYVCGRSCRSRPHSIETPARGASRIAASPACHPARPAKPASQPVKVQPASRASRASQVTRVTLPTAEKKPHAVKTQCYLTKHLFRRSAASKSQKDCGTRSNRTCSSYPGQYTRGLGDKAIQSFAPFLQTLTAAKLLHTFCTMYIEYHVRRVVPERWWGLCRWQLLSRRDKVID